MSALQTYLDENHDGPDSLKVDFQRKFGVSVRQEDDLFLFKYGIITSNWKEKVTHESRGAILRLENNGWTYMSRPFDKFFNQHEGHCPIFDSSAFAKHLQEAVIIEKADGSCIQMWHDGQSWRVSTLGSITTKNVYDEDVTFSELFFKTVGEIHLHELDPNFTYLFELCCDENRIVTQYTHNHAVYLGARERRSGSYLRHHELEYDINQGAFCDSNIRMPKMVKPSDRGLKTLDDVKLFVDQESDSEKYGKWPEGFIIYNLDGFHPLAKMKNARYMSLHHVGGGDVAHSKNQIINAIFLGYIDDVYDVLSTRLKNFADDIKQKAAKLTQETLVLIEKIKTKDFPTRKAFAAFLQDYADKKVAPFFFKNGNAFMNKKVEDPVALFEIWLKANYSKFEWKE